MHKYFLPLDLLLYNSYINAAYEASSSKYPLMWLSMSMEARFTYIFKKQQLPILKSLTRTCSNLLPQY